MKFFDCKKEFTADSAVIIGVQETGLTQYGIPDHTVYHIFCVHPVEGLKCLEEVLNKDLHPVRNFWRVRKGLLAWVWST